jgi:splicing factor 3A subunit 2
MDFQNRVGHKFGTMGPATDQEVAMDRRERLRKLALETIDLSKDPYFLRNHLGSYECKLCLTLHTNEGSYLAHTQGKKHQINLARRAAKEKQDQTIQPQPKTTSGPKKTVKIGRPGYRVTKERDPETQQKALLFEVEYPEVTDKAKPRHRFMSTYEQKIEPPDPNCQYMLLACEPYETIAFKIPNMDIDKEGTKFYVNWDVSRKVFTMQIFFKERELEELPALPQRAGSTQLAFHGGGGFMR